MLKVRRIFLFFGLGTQLRSTLDVEPISDDNIRQIVAYTPEKFEQVVNDLSCSTSAQSFLLKGEAKIDMDEAKLGSAMDKNEKRKYLGDDIDLETDENQDIAADLKTNYSDSFLPPLPDIRIGIAHHLLYCKKNTDGKPLAYLSNYKDYYPIGQDNINILENGDISINFNQNVTLDEIRNLQINDQDIPTLADLTYIGGLQQIKVFGNAEATYSKIMTLTFTSKEKTDDEEEPSSENAPTGGRDPDMVPLKTEFKKIEMPETVLLQPRTATDMVKVKDDTFKKLEQPTADNKSSVPAPSKNKIKNTTDPEIPEIITAFQRAKNTPAWFDPKLNGHAKEFYKVQPTLMGDKEIVYKPGTDNYTFWKDSAYQKKYLKDAEVNSICQKGYKYNRDFVLKIALGIPAEPSFTVTPADQGSEPISLHRTYRQFLTDQFLVDAKMEYIAEGLVEASLNVPSHMKYQIWNLKVCFDEIKGYTAFLSSTETSSIYTYDINTKRVARSSSRSGGWLQITKQTQKDVTVDGALLPKKFNLNRIKYPHSLFSIYCKDGDPNDCAVLFQLAFKRDLDATSMIAYMDQEKINTIRFLSVEKLLGKFSKKDDGTHKTNRNEIFVFGGFKFDPNNPTAPTPFMTSAQLQSEEYAPTEKFKTSAIANIIFPGEDSELYFNINDNGEQTATASK